MYLYVHLAQVCFLYYLLFLRIGVFVLLIVSQFYDFTTEVLVYLTYFLAQS